MYRRVFSSPPPATSFPDGHGRENISHLRDMGETAAADGFGGQTHERLPLERDISPENVYETEHCLDEGGLAAAIGTDERDELSRFDGQTDLVQHDQFAVSSTQTVNRQQIHKSSTLFIAHVTQVCLTMEGISNWNCGA